MATPVQHIIAIIEWTIEAAREHVELARFSGQEPDPEPGMGLWQSFQDKFPKVPGLDRDLQVAAWSASYRSAVKALGDLTRGPADLPSFRLGQRAALHYIDDAGEEDATRAAMTAIFGSIDGWIDGWIDEDGLPTGCDRDSFRSGALSVFAWGAE